MSAKNQHNSDDEVILAVRDSQGMVHKFRDDDVAEAVQLPTGQVLVVNMAGERGEPLAGKIIFARGEWKAWVKSGDETTSYDVTDGIQEHNGQVASWNDLQIVGSEITRLKRIELVK